MIEPTKELPEELEKDTPDWTFDDLVELVLDGREVRWLEHGRKLLSRGMIGQFPVQILVVQRAEFDAGLTKFLPTADDRFWWLDENGLEEMSLPEYQDAMKLIDESREAKTNWEHAVQLSTVEYRFVEARRSVIVFSRHAHPNHVLIGKHRVVRGDDGKIRLDAWQILGMS